jgi:two-component system cell cycle sensor histidine kinase/response regulator CckA
VTAPEPAPTVIPWHRRLEARVLIAVTLIAGVSLAAVLLAANQVVRKHSYNRSLDELVAARAAFVRLVESRARFASAQTRLIAELPVFRATLDPSSNVGGDAETISAMADEYRRKLSAEFCIVSDGRGVWIGAPGWPGGRPQNGVAGLIQSARNAQASHQIIAMDNGLFLVVSEPALFSEEVLGTITAGYKLDDKVAAELALETHCEVNLVCGSSRLCGSSLPADQRSALTSLVANHSSVLGNKDQQLAEIGATSYVSGVYPLRPAQPGSEDDAQLVLLNAWAPTQQALGDLQQKFVQIGVGMLGVMLGGTLVISRRLTRPLRLLSDAANDIAGGNWKRQLPATSGTAEARIMATAFNHMTLTLGQLHDEATTRSAQLQEAYDQFRAVTESANDAIVSLDSSARIVFWNRRAETVFGYTQDAAIGRSLSMLIVESDGEVGRYLASGDDQWLGQTIELTGRRQDGSTVPLELSLSTWKAGAAVFYTAVIRDITERRQSQAALRQREEQLRQAQKMEAVGRLAGGIAHDFNNLLTAILGYTDFLVQDVPADSKPDVEGIQKAGRSAAALTRQLLAFSRRQILQPEILDVNSVLANTDRLLRRLIGEDVEIKMDLAKDLPAVKADPGQIEQIILNLAVNARDAMPDGGRLTIATTREVISPGHDAEQSPAIAGPCAVITVSDTGCGMPPEVQSHIFEPFFTTKALGKGTGLGLATVYGIVQQSGGEIQLETAPGQGARFRIILPGVADAVPAGSSVENTRTPPSLGTETILLVEDNESVRALAFQALTRRGYRVVEATNGEEGVRIATELRGAIDLVITDVVMPVMGGRELSTRLLAMWPQMKILFTSGYTDDTILAEATMQPGTSFIQKPFTPDSLLPVVRAMLDRAGASV